MYFYGVKVSIKSLILFFITTVILGLGSLIAISEGKPAFYVIEIVWCVIAPYFLSYQIKSNENSTDTKVPIAIYYIIGFILNIVIVGINIWLSSYILGIFGWIYGKSGFPDLNLIYIFIMFCILTVNFNKKPIITNENVIKNNKVKSTNVVIDYNINNQVIKNNTTFLNLNLSNIDFDYLSKLYGEDFKDYIHTAFAGSKIYCKKSTMVGVELEINNQYVLALNLSEYALTVNILERFLLGLNNNMKLVIVSKFPYSEEVVNWCIENKLNVELLLVEDFKQITNYFYTPRYEKLGISFFEYMQSQVLKNIK